MRFNAMLFGIVLAFTLVSAGAYPVVPLTYSALSADTYRVATQSGDVACGASSSQDWIYSNAKLIEIKSASPIFGGPGDALSGNYYFTKVLFDPIGLTGNGSTSLNGTYFQSTNPAQWAPRVFWKVPGRDCFNWNNVIYADPTIGLEVARDPGTTWGYIKFENALISGATKHTMVLNEGIGIGGANSAIEYISNSSYMTMRFKENDGSTSIVYYNTFAGAGYVSYEPVFITERGTRWLTVGTTDVSAQLATKLAKPNFVFRTSAPPVGSSTWPQYSFETLITDTVDRAPQNRQNTLPEDEYASLLSSPDTSGQITSPLRAVEEGNRVAKNLYRIGGNEYAPFSDYVVVDGQAPGFNYIEKQAYWIGTTPAGVAYDSGAAYRDVIVNKYSAMATSAKFEGNDYGIPMCTGDLAVTGDWTSCISNINNASGFHPLTDRHRVGIKFLNQNWIISQMAAPITPLASSTAAINGGQVKLAKEAQYGILMVNQSLYNGQLYVRLNNVLPASFGCQYNESVAIYDILNSGNAVIGQVQVCPGETYAFVQQGTGNKVMIHAYMTHYATIPSQRLAETALYSEEIVLKDGVRYNLVSSQDPDKNFKVSLLWKNRDYTGAGSSAVADSLREIVVYQTDNFEKTPKMGVYNLLNSQPAFRVTYAGISPISSVGPVPKPVPVDIIKKEEPAPVSIVDETAKAKQEIAPTATKEKPKPIIKAKPKVQSSETVAQKEQVTDPPAAEKTRGGNARVEKNAAPAAVQIQPKPKETPAPVKETVRSTAPAKSENKAYEPANAKRAEASDQ